MTHRALLFCVLACTSPLFFAVTAPAQTAATYDLVVSNGRVMDPETGLDAVRNVGIRGGRIVRIAAEPLAGKRVLDASGLVVAPGFIDLHQHGQELESQRVKAMDGVTTALEMEIGVPDVGPFLAKKQGSSMIHYGTTASHVAARALVFGVKLEDIIPAAGRATNDPATPEQIAAMRDRLAHEIALGALGVGMGIQYVPGATRHEVIEMFREAASHGLPVFTHVRSFGRLEPGSSIESIGEVISAAAITGASLHIVHMNSSCAKDGLECLAMIAGARARGLDVTTEAYPYAAGMTDITSALFNPGWKEKLGVDYAAIQLPATGERLSQARFDELHVGKPQEVLLWGNTEAMVDQEIPNPLVMIASDGGPGHPRNAGTYSRILGHYVRERGNITLMDAIRKMSLMPAQRLEKSTPEARRKGRLQEGADADIVVFDPLTVSDRSTYQKPMEPSVGMKYVLVAGTPVVSEGKLVEGVFPGQAVLGSGKK